MIVTILPSQMNLSLQCSVDGIALALCNHGRPSRQMLICFDIHGEEGDRRRCWADDNGSDSFYQNFSPPIVEPMNCSDCVLRK